MLICCSLLSVISSIVAGLFLTEGPHLVRATTGAASKKQQSEQEEALTERGAAANASANISSTSATNTPSVYTRIFQNRSFWISTVGYCGHNWELYALWLWFKKFAIKQNIGGMLWSTEDPSRGGSLAAFLVVASAMIGSVTAGLAADRIGRTTVCLCSLFVSIVVSLVIGWIPAEMPGLSLVVGIFWGIFAVAESAQYSAMTSEVVDKDVVGNAVTIQFGIGYVNRCCYDL